MAKLSREIVREYYKGIQVLNYKNRAPNLHSILLASTEKFPDKNALECHSGTRTYEQFVEDVDRLAAAMQESMGVAKGDRVALLLGNDLAFPITFFAAARIGAVAVPINTRSVANDIAYIVNNSGARVVVVDPSYLKEFTRSRKSTPGVEHVVVTAPTDGASNYLQLDSILSGPPRKPEEVKVDENDLACIFYTAGTMGAPKGALCTHRNFVSNSMNTRLATGGSSDGRALICVPLCHPTGCHSQLISGIFNGSTGVIQRHFNADETLSLIEKAQITSLVGVPTMYWLMLAQMKLKDYSLSTLRNVNYGGAPASPELVRRLREVFPTARLGNGYGLTETSAMATFLPDEYAMEKPDSVGPPVPTVEIRIVDDADNNLIPGKIGEILLKGPSVVDGYWEDPEATSESFTNGWFHTGDLGRVDSEGFLSIVDRKKDMIIRGGENIYCVEIENVLESHPDVFQAAVVGEPDKVFGEQVKAYIIPNPGRSLSVDEILDFCDEHLADFKVPKYVEFVGALPRNPAGKVDKRMLRH
jgi:acyl-CoA synthetase (AMP-forming)/AMP-acid ligase II